jgi:hypothetical protein
MSILVAFGGGVNSTAMLIGLIERGIYPSWILFSDTGGEKPETYSHIEVVDHWLKGRGWYGITRLHKNSMYESLEDECLRRNTLPSLAFGWRSCSDKWKQEPQRKFMNHDTAARKYWEAGQKITKAIGFGADELRRAKPYEDEKYRNWYPLVDWGWDRTECVKAIERAGLDVPPKSACFYCPASTKQDVKVLAESNPELLQRAIAMEENARGLVKIKGLGRHWSWKDLTNAPEEHCIEQTCMCFDGE